MCIICVSPRGVSQPTVHEIKTMFRRNPHGAGYMVARGGRVEIHKGFATIASFLAAIASEHFTADDVVVYHFRISTQAGTTPAMTHPFPVTSDERFLQALDVSCPLAAAHNGIIRSCSDPAEKTFSDTAIFIRDYLAPIIKTPSDISRPSIFSFIQESIGYSKMAFLDGAGNVTTVGAFIKDHGRLYSNSTYRDFPW